MIKPLTPEQNARIISAMAALVLLSAGTAAFAQATTTLRDDLFRAPITRTERRTHHHAATAPRARQLCPAPAGMTAAPAMSPG